MSIPEPDLTPKPPPHLSDLEQLIQEYETRQANHPVVAEDMLIVLRRLDHLSDVLNRNRQTIADTVVSVNQNEAFIEALQERLQIVDVLPTSAPFGAIIRLNAGPVAGRVPLYVGNGNGQPLTKLTPTAL